MRALGKDLKENAEKERLTGGDSVLVHMLVCVHPSEIYELVSDCAPREVVNLDLAALLPGKDSDDNIARIVSSVNSAKQGSGFVDSSMAECPK